MYPVASASSSSFVCETPRASNTFASVGSASFAFVIAAIARRSSSFSACVVPRSRQASQRDASARTAASSASEASERFPSRNSRFPSSSASARPRYGFGSVKTYVDRSARFSAWSSFATWSHTFSLIQSGRDDTWSSNSFAHSSGTFANSSAHICAAFLSEFSCLCLSASISNCAAHCAAAPPESANSFAHPPLFACSAPNSLAHAAPALTCAGAGSAFDTPVSLTASPSTTISPLLMRDMNLRNSLFWNFGSAFCDSVSTSPLACAAVSACAAVGPPSLAASVAVASCASRNSLAHAPPGVCCSANSLAHSFFSPAVSEPPPLAAAYSFAHAAPPLRAPAPEPAPAASPTRIRANSLAHAFSLENSRAHPALAFAAASALACPPADRGPSIIPRASASPASIRSGDSARASLARTSASLAPFRCRAMIALLSRIVVFSSGESSRRSPGGGGGGG
mmetsp:Transcript_2599/g.8351  ORF Transcript_2599/g.8351 Transcript_2599/m.8351 type:complete len:455 (+) Transcript_2599:597-1961(+)